jgi:DNA mismatch repair protein MutS
VLEDRIKGIKNLTVDVSEENGNIIFLHKIVEGSASKSYGIHVAKLAGIPKDLINNAKRKLLELEKGSVSIEIKDYISTQTSNEEVQISMFMEDLKPNPIIEKLKSIDLMEITPSQAIKILEELKESIDD